MVIHVVRPGDTPYNLAREYGVPLSFLLTDNGLEPSDTLVVGQALVIQFPERTHTVRPGETLDAIARQYGVSLRQLYRNNPILGGRPLLYPDLTLVLSYRGPVYLWFYPHRCAGPPGRRGTDRNGAPGRYRPSHASVHPDGGGRFFQ